jgi:hypothetical protein
MNAVETRRIDVAVWFEREEARPSGYYRDQLNYVPNGGINDLG